MRLRNIIDIMRKRAWMVAATAAIVTLVAVLVGLFTAPSYQGQATVLLTQQNAGTALLGSPQQYQSDLALQRDVQTQVNVMRSPIILGQVITALSLSTSPTELAKHLSVRFDGQTNIVTVEVVGPSSAIAANTANAIAATYVDWSQRRQRSSIRAAADDVEKRLEAAQKHIVAVQAAIASGDRSGARQVELQAANSLYATLADKLESLNINEQLATGSGSILTSATPNPVPVTPKPVRNGALGLAVGLVLGLGIAFVAETLDNTVKSSEQAQELLGAPVLCSIPVDKQKKGEHEGLALVDNPGGPAAEAYRMLRNNLGFINFEHDIKAVLVTSALPREGKSTVAANLAMALASAGNKVVIVCCDFHQPGSARFFKVDDRIGLSDALRGTMSLQGVIEQQKNLQNLWVIPAGKKPPNPSELLGSSAMKGLVGSLREKFDWVILDSPPVLVVADAAAAVQWVDGVLVVTHANVTTRDATRKSREQLEHVGARILGVALWGLEDAAARGSYGYSHYGASSAG